LELERELLAERRRDIAPAAGDLAKRAHQLFRRAFLGEIARRAGLESAYGIPVLRIHRQDQDCATRVALAQLLDELEPVLAGHVVVEHRDFPRHSPRELDHFLPVARLADDGEVGLDGEHLPQSLSHYRMVIGDEDFHLAFLNGIVTDTRVPWPGEPLILTSPPKSSARSCMPSRPSDFFACSSLSWMPTPLSTTSSETSAALTASSMSTRVAREWRATLVRISWKMRN